MLWFLFPDLPFQVCSAYCTGPQKTLKPLYNLEYKYLFQLASSLLFEQAILQSAQTHTPVPLQLDLVYLPKVHKKLGNGKKVGNECFAKYSGWLPEPAAQVC